MVSKDLPVRKVKMMTTREARKWAGLQTQFQRFLSGKYQQTTRSHGEKSNYSEMGLRYVCGITFMDLAKLIGDKCLESLVVPPGMDLRPGHLITAYRDEAEVMKELRDAGLEPNYDPRFLPTVIDSEGRTVRAQAGYLAVHRIIDPERFLGQSLQVPRYTIHGPQGLVLEPTLLRFLA